MWRKRILVPIGESTRTFTSVHYALSLAQRVQGRVYILQKYAEKGFDKLQSGWVEEALLDLLNTARQEGLKVSLHIANGDFRDEIEKIVKSKEIDLVVIGDNENPSAFMPMHLKPPMKPQIIRVKEKDGKNYSKEDSEKLWQL